MPSLTRFAVWIALTCPLASCASINNAFASMQPELTRAELSALTSEAGCDVVPLRHYATVEGTLSQGDCQDSRGRFVDYFGLRTDDEPYGQQFQNTRFTIIQLSSDEFDSFLRVKPKEGRDWWEDDDGGSGVNAYMRRPLGDGLYLIAVTSRRHETGAYKLELGRSAPPPR